MRSYQHHEAAITIAGALQRPSREVLVQLTAQFGA
jgi:hypothetical protein